MTLDRFPEIYTLSDLHKTPRCPQMSSVACFLCFLNLIIYQPLFISLIKETLITMTPTVSAPASLAISNHIDRMFIFIYYVDLFYSNSKFRTSLYSRCLV